MRITKQHQGRAHNGNIARVGGFADQQRRATPMCSHKDCRRRASHHIGMKLVNEAGGVRESSLGLALCHKHAIEATRDPGTIKPAGWQQIEDMLTRMGLPPLDRARTRLFVRRGATPKAPAGKVQVAKREIGA